MAIAPLSFAPLSPSTHAITEPSHVPTRGPPTVTPQAPLCIADWDVALTHAVRSLRREASPSLVLSCARSVGPRAPGGGVQMLLIAGAHDRIVAPAQVVNMARSVFVGAEVVVVPECGHMSNEERPDVLTDRLSRFVRSCVSQPA